VGIDPPCRLPTIRDSCGRSRKRRHFAAYFGIERFYDVGQAQASASGHRRNGLARPGEILAARLLTPARAERSHRGPADWGRRRSTRIMVQRPTLGFSDRADDPLRMRLSKPGIGERNASFLYIANG